MKTPNKKPIVISTAGRNPLSKNPFSQGISLLCQPAFSVDSRWDDNRFCVLAVRNLMSKDHVPVGFLVSPSGRFTRNDNDAFRIFGFAEPMFLLISSAFVTRMLPLTYTKSVIYA